MPLNRHRPGQKERESCLGLKQRHTYRLITLILFSRSCEMKSSECTITEF